jgi:hypothetical protein
MRDPVGHLMLPASVDAALRMKQQSGASRKRRAAFD